MGSTDAQLITFEEVAKHNKKFDCWLIISGKVYDVTPFLDDHPGGDEILLTATGKDATDDFDDVNHSEEATGMLKSYYIGDLDTSTLPGKHQYNQTSVDGSAPIRTSTPKSLEIFQFLVDSSGIRKKQGVLYIHKQAKIGSRCLQHEIEGNIETVKSGNPAETNHPTRISSLAVLVLFLWMFA